MSDNLFDKFRGQFSNVSEYAKDDIVKYNGALYKSLENISNSEFNPAKWARLTNNVSNKNLLKNWDFRNPVNFNGFKTIMTGGVKQLSEPFIDEWKWDYQSGGGKGYFSLQDKSLLIVADQKGLWIKQFVTEKLAIGNSYTLSVKIKDIGTTDSVDSNIAGKLVFKDSRGNDLASVNILSNQSNSIISCTASSLKQTCSHVQFVVQGKYRISVEAMKLETGNQSTLLFDLDNNIVDEYRLNAIKPMDMIIEDKNFVFSGYSQYDMGTGDKQRPWIITQVGDTITQSINAISFKTALKPVTGEANTYEWNIKLSHPCIKANVVCTPDPKFLCTIVSAQIEGVLAIIRLKFSGTLPDYVYLNISITGQKIPYGTSDYVGFKESFNNDEVKNRNSKQKDIGLLVAKVAKSYYDYVTQKNNKAFAYGANFIGYTAKSDDVKNVKPFIKNGRGMVECDVLTYLSIMGIPMDPLDNTSAVFSKAEQDILSVSPYYTELEKSTPTDQNVLDDPSGQVNSIVSHGNKGLGFYPDWKYSTVMNRKITDTGNMISDIYHKIILAGKASTTAVVFKNSAQIESGDIVYFREVKKKRVGRDYVAHTGILSVENGIRYVYHVSAEHFYDPSDKDKNDLRCVYKTKLEDLYNCYVNPEDTIFVRLTFNTDNF